MSLPDDRLIIAIDTPDLSGILRLANSLRDIVRVVKIGSTSFNAHGPELIGMIKSIGMDVFLDLKLFDIPQQVTQTVRDITSFGVKMFTIHTFGGIDMMKGAAQATAEQAERLGIKKPLVMGVTILTSIDDEWLRMLGFDGAERGVDRLVGFASASGLDGVVASGDDAVRIKDAHQGLKVLVPGIRLDSTPKDDQKRISTPEAAIKNGADYLVVGRPVTQSKDPGSAAMTILERIRG